MNEVVKQPDTGFDLAAAMGVGGGGASAEYLDRLTVQYSVLDPANNEVATKVGQFRFKHDGEYYYAPEVSIAVVGNHYQYVRYDPADNKYTGRTLILPDFKGEFRDDNGTVKLGMIKRRSDMDDDEKKMFKDVTCQRQLRVLLNMVGEDHQGAEKEIKNAPALLTLKGANFMPFEDQIVKHHKDFRTNWIELSTSRQKSGGNIYYTIDFDWTDEEVDIHCDDYTQTLMHFLQLIKDENKDIERAYDAALVAA